MKIPALRALISAIDEGSLRAAARRIGVSQPALTKMIRELELKPKVLAFLRVLARSLGIAVDGLDVTFPPLWSMSDKEQAELRKTVADTDVAYINAGVLLPEEVALSRFAKGAWSAETEVDLDVPRDAVPPPAVPGVPDFAAGSGG